MCVKKLWFYILLKFGLFYVLCGVFCFISFGGGGMLLGSVLGGLFCLFGGGLLFEGLLGGMFGILGIGGFVFGFCCWVVGVVVWVVLVCVGVVCVRMILVVLRMSMWVGMWFMMFFFGLLVLLWLVVCVLGCCRYIFVV